MGFALTVEQQPLSVGRRDRGVLTAVEMMYMLVFCLLAVALLTYVGRLHAAGVEVTNAAQSAARAASQTRGASEAFTSARQSAAQGPLGRRCDGGPRVSMNWQPSAIGTWQGGSVTVTVSCSVANASLSGLWSPGTRLVVMSDTQPIDRYKR
ncbi:MAG: hypothetical protein ACKOYG_10380 [Ilumatobacteraceae bacterium]